MRLEVGFHDNPVLFAAKAFRGLGEQSVSRDYSMRLVVAWNADSAYWARIAIAVN